MDELYATINDMGGFNIANHFPTIDEINDKKKQEKMKEEEGLKVEEAKKKEALMKQDAKEYEILNRMKNRTELLRSFHSIPSEKE